MEINEILDALRYFDGNYPREAMEEAVRRRNEIIPHFLKALEDTVAMAPAGELEERYFLYLPAMFLLAQFRETRAYPVVIEMCRLPEYVIDELLGESITEDLQRVLASVYDGDPGPLKGVIEEPSVHAYVRGSALRALGILYLTEAIPRRELVEYYRELFRGGLEERYSHVWDELASEVVDNRVAELKDDVMSCYSRGLLDPGYTSPLEVQETFVHDDYRVPDNVPYHRRLMDDVVNLMGRWVCFNEDGLWLP